MLRVVSLSKALMANYLIYFFLYLFRNLSNKMRDKSIIQDH